MLIAFHLSDVDAPARLIAQDTYITLIFAATHPLHPHPLLITSPLLSPCLTTHHDICVVGPHPLLHIDKTVIVVGFLSRLTLVNY